MARWEPDAAARLREAAIELFVAQGYDHTTVADIAERAGLTARTFFRHFADKREVLFDGAGLLQEAMVAAVAEAPASAPALDAVAAALDAAAAVLTERQAFVRQRREVIDANPELRERELIKLAGLTDALAAALRKRGVREPKASLAAEAGIAAFRVGFRTWVTATRPVTLSRALRASLDRLAALCADRQ